MMMTMVMLMMMTMTFISRSVFCFWFCWLYRIWFSEFVTTGCFRLSLVGMSFCFTMGIRKALVVCCGSGGGNGCYCWSYNWLTDCLLGGRWIDRMVEMCISYLAKPLLRLLLLLTIMHSWSVSNYFFFRHPWKWWRMSDFIFALIYQFGQRAAENVRKIDMRKT